MHFKMVHETCTSTVYQDQEEDIAVKELTCDDATFYELIWSIAWRKERESRVFHSRAKRKTVLGENYIVEQVVSFESPRQRNKVAATHRHTLDTHSLTSKQLGNRLLHKWEMWTRLRPPRSFLIYLYQPRGEKNQTLKVRGSLNFEHLALNSWRIFDIKVSRGSGRPAGRRAPAPPCRKKK